MQFYGGHISAIKTVLCFHSLRKSNENICCSRSSVVLWVVVVLTVKAGVLVIGVGDGHVTIFVGHGRIGFVV